MLIRHEARRSEKSLGRVARRGGEKFPKRVERTAVQGEDHFATLEIDQTTDDVAGLSRRIVVRNRFGAEPN